MYVTAVDYNSKNAPAAFTDSLYHTGFGVIENPPLNIDRIHRVYQEWETFFNSPLKYDYTFDPKVQAGFFPIEKTESAKGFELKDIKEFYHHYPWHPLPKLVGRKTIQVYNELSKLAGELLSWIEKNTPKSVNDKLSMPLKDMIKDSPQTLLRIIHYPPFSGKEQDGAVRAAAHEDINLITLLPFSTQSGLQVKDKEGNWHEVSRSPDVLAVNTGDMLDLATGGHYKATTHRVVNPTGEDTNKSRFSMPLFLHPRPEVRLSDKHTQASYLKERLLELGLIKKGKAA